MNARAVWRHDPLPADLRLVPIVLFATISLFALKTIGLHDRRHYTLGGPPATQADITGSVRNRTLPALTSGATRQSN